MTHRRLPGVSRGVKQIPEISLQEDGCHYLTTNAVMITKAMTMGGSDGNRDRTLVFFVIFCLYVSLSLPLSFHLIQFILEIY